jgi:hypothetical protein
VAQVVEHVITFTVDDAAFENGVVQAAGSHNFFGGKFRFMIARSAIRPGAEETDERDLSYIRAAGGFDGVAGAVDVNTLIGVTCDFAIDSRAMRDGIATREGMGEFGGIIQADLKKSDARELLDRWIGAVVTASDERDMVSVRHERVGEIAADEAGAAGDGDFHTRPPFHAAQA